MALYAHAWPYYGDNVDHRSLAVSKEIRDGDDQTDVLREAVRELRELYPDAEARCSVESGSLPSLYVPTAYEGLTIRERMVNVIAGLTMPPQLGRRR